MSLRLSLFSLLMFSLVILQRDQWHQSGLAEARGIHSISHFHLRPHFPMNRRTSVLTASATTTEKEPKADPFVLFRIPAALGSTIHTLCLVFLQSAVFMIPVGLVVKIGSRPTIPTNFKGNIQHWLSEGTQVGMEWARISALFSGGEVFCEKLRLVPA